MALSNRTLLKCYAEVCLARLNKSLSGTFASDSRSSASSA